MITATRRVHNLGLFTFAAGALGCALAPNAALLLGFRVIQGIGASMYQATNMALIVEVFPKEQRGRALGLMSTFVAAGSMAGPALGGFPGAVVLLGEQLLAAGRGVGRRKSKLTLSI
ncbi:MFS transporter [Paenibacillus donghaensis]|nr:MFS transporter [Paenibacillus donghaensis]